MSSVTFLKQDSTTQGAWHGVYGSDGYGIIGNSSSTNNSTIPVTQGYFSYPAYATVSLAGETAFCWASNTGDVIGLQYPPPSTNHVLAAWFKNASFTLDIADGSNHQVALYFQDEYHTTQRTQTVTITDDQNAGQQLWSTTLSNFQNGVWLVWNISGQVTFTITLVSGDNAILSGIFFDPAAATPPVVFPPLVSRPRFEPTLFE